MTTTLDPMPPGGELPPFQITVDGFSADFFRVHSFDGKEAASEAYCFDVVVTAQTGGDDDIERLALGQRAVLTWNVDAAPRTFHGILAAVRLHGVHDADESTKYHLRFVPRLWLLKRKKRSRIFQKLSIPDIVSSVLAEEGIATRFQLMRTYPIREYCTQYEESDYRFVTRLLAEAGIFFYFHQGAALGAASAGDRQVPGDTVVCGDDAGFYPPIGSNPSEERFTTAAAVSAREGGTTGRTHSAAGVVLASWHPVPRVTSKGIPILHFLEMGATSTTPLDKITRFSVQTTVRANRAHFREYDPQNPGVRVHSSATSTVPFAPSALETTGSAKPPLEAADEAFAAAAAPESGAAPRPGLALEVYEHHDPFLFPRWTFAGDEAQRILRQKRRRASIATGDSGCPTLAPGHQFALRDHPANHLDGSYVVTAVEHRGRAYPQGSGDWQLYENSFECAPAEIAYVPPRPKRKSVQVSLTATVVGPPGEEIFVDAMGQIKVQFHWDREGSFNESSSCWIRTMQPWGGVGWGVQFIPRVGMEVVVGFEGGDPDKPLVLGSIYNATHPSPFMFPAQKTRSGWKTQSSPGGNGFNELSFDDAAAHEQIYLHAQRNLDEVVRRNHSLVVHHDEFIRVLGNRLDRIEQNHALQVHGDQTTTVEGNRVDVVTGSRDDRVSGTLVTQVEGRERRAVTGATDYQLADDVTTRVSGCVTTLVGQHDKKRSWTTHAEGTAKLSSLDATEVSSEKELVLRVGKSSIRMTEDAIEIASSTIRVTGGGAGLRASDEGLALSSKGPAQLVAAGKIVFKATSATLAMEKQVKVDGAQILLNSPDQATDPAPKDPEPPTTIDLKDEDGSPLAYQRFLVMLDGGVEIGGLTSKDGHAELELSAGGKVVFPDISLRDEPGAQGDMRPYLVKQGDYLTKLAFVHGFDAEGVWNDAKNAELKKRRPDPNMLVAGDVLNIPTQKKPGVPLKKGTTNSYVARVPKVEVALVFCDGDEPIANEPYVVEGLGEQLAGTTDPTGQVVLAVPVHSRALRIVFEKRHMTFPIHVGDLDPVEEPTGLQGRLEHLGYMPPLGEAAEADRAAHVRRAIRAFQEAKGLQPTGVADAATNAALVQAHGS